MRNGRPRFMGPEGVNMSAINVPTLDLVHDTLETEVAYLVSRMRVLERIPGNPIGIAFREIDGAAIGLMAQRLPSPFFNSVMGLRAEHSHHIPSLVAWHRDHGVNGRFVIEPGDYSAELGRQLVKLGYYQSGFHAKLIGESVRPAPVPSGIVIELVTTAAAMEEYLDAYVAGWGIPPSDQEQFKANVRPWLGQPGWSLYLARVDGRPAAAATLYVLDRGAYCADAATHPDFRRLGLQAALLRRRIQDAREAGAEFVFSGADYLSPSHRNMERVGMRLLSLRTIWTSL
jgi:GNAT superfamily N-acetyltransferase